MAVVGDWVTRNRSTILLLGSFALVLLLCGAVVLFRAPGSEPDPAPSDPVPSPSAPSTAPPVSREPTVVEEGTGRLLPGADDWTLYVQAATAVYRVELDSGLITRTATARLEQHASFVAGEDRVVVKVIGFPPSSGTQPPAPGTVVVDGLAAEPLPTGLTATGRLYPAPHGDLWSVPEVDSGPTTASRVDVTGARRKGGRLTVPQGFAQPDGAGSLLTTNAAGIYQLTRRGPRHLSDGTLLAVGRHHLLLWDCDRAARCQPYRLDRRSGHRTALPRLSQEIRRLTQGVDPAGPSFWVGEVSPDGRHAVLEYDSGEDGPRFDILSLDRPAAHQVPGLATGVNANTQYAWTPDSRWLLALTGGRIRAYDTRTHRTRTLGPTQEDLLHLTMLGASGN